MSDSDDRTASLMTPARLAQLQARPRPAASPAAWLDQLAADAGSGHARRLVDLHGQVDAAVRARDHEPLRAALHALYEGLKALDYDLVQPKGWLSRTLGRGKDEAATFVAQYEAVVRAGEAVAAQLKALQRGLPAGDPAGERALLEVDVEVRAIEKVMDQGARWLQDMRNQIKTRAAQGDASGGAQQQAQEDAARCELLVERLKVLRGTVGPAQQLARQCRAAAVREAAFLAAVQQALDGEWARWHALLEPLAAAVLAGAALADTLDAARGAHQALQSTVKQLARDCMQLQKQDELLATELGTLRDPLQAAA